MNQELVDRAAQLGVEYEVKYRGCGQCVIAAVQDAFGIRGPEVFQAASAFAAGVGQTGDGCCGAYLGGAMVLSSLKGRSRDNFADPEEIRKESCRMTRRLREHFIQEYGSVICRDIHTKIFGRPFYIVDPDDMVKFDEAGAHTPPKCPAVVGKAASVVARIILEEGLPAK